VVVPVENIAVFQRKTTTSNAIGKSILKAFKLGDPLGDTLMPSLGQTTPLLGGGNRVYGQLAQFDSNLLQSKTHALGKDNERYTSHY
jgi:hypothetical protein